MGFQGTRENQPKAWRGWELEVYVGLWFSVSAGRKETAVAPPGLQGPQGMFFCKRPQRASVLPFVKSVASLSGCLSSFSFTTFCKSKVSLMYFPARSVCLEEAEGP